MGIDYTTAGMISSVKRRAMLPDSQQLYGDDEICAILSEEMYSDIVPLIMAIREEYLVHYYDQAIDTSVSSYLLPERATGMKLRDAVLLTSDSKEVSLPRINPDVVKHQAYLGSYSLYIFRRGFHFVDNSVVLFPDASSLGNYSLRMKYFRRPNYLTTTTKAGYITVLDTAQNQVTLNRLPSSWTVSTTFDFIKAKPPFVSRGDDKTITSIDTVNKILTFSSLPSDIAVGDWVCDSGTSPIAQLPYEVFCILEQRAVVKILEGMNSDGLSEAKDVYKDMVSKFQALVSPRADGSPKRIVRGNRLFGGSRGSYWQ